MILGLIEHDRGTLNEASLEMLTLARSLGQSLTAVLIGAEAQPLAAGLAAYGVTAVYLVEDDRLDSYAPEAWAQSVVALITSLEPDAVIVPDAVMAAGTDRGHEVMAHVAARLDLPLAANCTAVHPGDDYQVTRLRWGGSLLEEARLKGTPKLLTVAPHTIAAAETAVAGDLTLTTITPSLTDKDFRVRVTGRVETSGNKVSLGQARVVVGGGRGVGSAAGFDVLQELADLIGGAVGGSRVATNQGWRPHADQIGQTGTRIAPELYIACGVSGAIQHMVGCKGSKQILAINTDPEAPMVTKADYAVIGDLHQVIPALITEIKNLHQL